MANKIKNSNLDDSIVTTAKIGADAVTGAKIADDAINSEHLTDGSIDTAHIGAAQITNAKLNDDVITGATALGAAAQSADTLLIYDNSAGVLKKVTVSEILNFPNVTSVSPANALSGDGTGNHTFVFTGTAMTGGVVSLINDSGSTVNLDSQTVDSDTQITGVIAKSSLPNSGEPYDIKIAGSTGLSGTLNNAITVDANPIWQTSAGSLATVAHSGRTNTTYELTAHDPESSAITYTVESGSLPAGLSGTSTSSGYVITGTPDAVGSNTTSSFTIRAKDANSNIADRAFSITINAPATQTFTSSGTFSVPSGTTAVEVLVVAGAGAGGTTYTGPQGGGGGGGGGLVYSPSFTVTPGATLTVTVGNGGSPSPAGTGGQGGGGGTGGAGGNSVFGTITANGGGGGANADDTGGSPGGSGGGGASGGASSPGGSSTQSPSAGAPGFGNSGGSSPSGNNAGGGGGGAAQSGSNGSGSNGGAGGNGKAYNISGSEVYYSGGGGGAGKNNGPNGSGGQGGAKNANTGSNGDSNKGGGSGGVRNTGFAAGNGGKGVVIVKF